MYRNEPESRTAATALKKFRSGIEKVLADPSVMADPACLAHWLKMKEHAEVAAASGQAARGAFTVSKFGPGLLSDTVTQVCVRVCTVVV